MRQVIQGLVFLLALTLFGALLLVEPAPQVVYAGITSTPTNTPAAPTNTPDITATFTPVAPTNTATPLPPTVTLTATTVTTTPSGGDTPTPPSVVGTPDPSSPSPTPEGTPVSETPESIPELGNGPGWYELFLGSAVLLLALLLLSFGWRTLWKYARDESGQ